MQKHLLSLSFLAIVVFFGTTAAAQSLYQGLISFRDGPDPAGRTPVYWATSRTLYHVSNPRAAEVKFGTNWVSQIRWCGYSNNTPLPGECADIFNNFTKSATPITEYTRDLLHP